MKLLLNVNFYLKCAFISQFFCLCKTSKDQTSSGSKLLWYMQNSQWRTYFFPIRCTSRPPNCIWNKPNLFANASFCTNSFQYAKIFSQPLINPDFFFTSGIGPDTLMNVLEDCIVSLFEQSEFCLIFILSKNNDFQFGASLKIPLLLPRMNLVRYSQTNKFKTSKDLSFQK